MIVFAPVQHFFLGIKALLSSVELSRVDSNRSI